MMILPLRPAGPRAFLSADMPGLIDWLRSQGASDAADGRFRLGDGWVRVAADGRVEVGGDGWELVYKMLLFACEE
jgi:hypothetical protein